MAVSPLRRIPMCYVVCFRWVRVMSGHGGPVKCPDWPNPRCPNMSWRSCRRRRRRRRWPAGWPAEPPSPGQDTSRGEAPGLAMSEPQLQEQCVRTHSFFASGPSSSASFAGRGTRQHVRQPLSSSSSSSSSSNVLSTPPDRRRSTSLGRRVLGKAKAKAAKACRVSNCRTGCPLAVSEPAMQEQRPRHAAVRWLQAQVQALWRS